MVTLQLPYPPSINHYYSYYRGRPVLTKDARSYRRRVRSLLKDLGLKPLMGPLAVRIEMHPPDNRRRDCDNVQKAVLDAMQHGGAFWDDSQIDWLLTVRRPQTTHGKTVVSIHEIDEQSPSTDLPAEMIL